MSTIPTTRALLFLSLSPKLRSLHNWWHERREKHYLICADVEDARAREAHRNASYFQKKAALARIARL